MYLGFKYLQNTDKFEPKPKKKKKKEKYKYENGCLLIKSPNQKKVWYYV